MTMPTLSLENQVALVTGARRGIGEVRALVFAEAGVDVVVCDWVTETGELDAVAEKIENFGRRALAIHADVKKRTDIERFIKKGHGHLRAYKHSGEQGKGWRQRSEPGARGFRLGGFKGVRRRNDGQTGRKRGHRALG